MSLLFGSSFVFPEGILFQFSGSKAKRSPLLIELYRRGGISIVDPVQKLARASGLWVIRGARTMRNANELRLYFPGAAFTCPTGHARGG